MSLYLGNNLIAPNQSNAANQSLSNLNATGQDVIDSKADVDLTNVTDTANIKIAHNAMPSDTYIDLTLGASGTTYTAPADGYVFIRKVVGQSWYYVNIDIYSPDDTFVYGIFSDTYTTSPSTILLPIQKDWKYEITYNATGSTTHFRFIYAVGSESEAS